MGRLIRCQRIPPFGFFDIDFVADRFAAAAALIRFSDDDSVSLWILLFRFVSALELLQNPIDRSLR